MNMGNNTQQQLKSIIERIENLDEEISELREGQKEIFQEAKSNGYDLPALRATLARRKAMRKDAQKQISKEQIMETYLHALGDLADLPLGQAAVERMAANPSIRRAVKALGTPVELTEEEKAKGYSSAFIGKDGTRMSIGIGNGAAKQVDLEEAIAEKS